MTEEQYQHRRHVIMQRIYRHEDKFANGSPKYPRCLRADIQELQKLEEEWKNERSRTCSQ